MQNEGSATDRMPDKEHTWDEWLRMLLEDLFVIDAPTLYPLKTKGGDVAPSGNITDWYGFEPIDGATIKRFILPNATVMIHQPSSGTRGKVTDQEIDLRESLRIKRLLEEIMARNTGQKVEKIHDDMERDKWLTAEDAKKYGIVDAVITSPKALQK